MTQARPSDAKAIANEVFRVISWVVLIIALIYTFVVSLWMFIEQVPVEVEVMFVEMQIPGGLPVLTRLFLQYSFIPWLVALAGIAGLVKEFLMRDRRITLIINAIHVAGVVLVHQLFVVAMYLPKLKIMETIGGP